MDDYDPYLDVEPDEEERPRDAKIDEAKLAILDVFEREPQRVFYSVQIETRLEREYFHWITNKGLSELAQERQLAFEPRMIAGTQRVHFYTYPTYRYFRREAKRLEGVLTQLYDPDFTHAVGRHCEMLLDSALARAGFQPQATDANAWNGKQWTQTKHNLDRIVVKDSIAYGVEIKNTQNYIGRPELRTKLRMCEHLQLRPLFIMRFAPKSYIEEVRRAGGFTLLFEEQIYPFGFVKLMREVREALGLKVQCPRDFKEGDIQRLVNWHDKKLSHAK
ncbi:hypothetical protein [Burkholderia pseudomallei]|uniref:hypothetical protein n=1 Tax=Burkholderia pseudomallei TaxID=28450 RepID=UPI000530D484|nr:hypothetical protein [Burkholderia pseudomallei]KGS60305.1 hypothetical protein X990_6010 [Burkholderia pseudomallei MSHR4868]KGX23963.1 hypothetical protein X984_6136 [Burkholderia pseudomallei]KGX30070.1 hypothetical protein X986_6140 [Burkholderia pseudomallei]MBY7655921.1 hypothetical protein [Burkholderia pseudomallei]MDV2130278.1 hypothetical protein [Burkholderia pseudomallei]